MQPSLQVQDKISEVRPSIRSRSLGKIVLGISTITIGAKVFGFLEKVIVAHYMGTTQEADVYFAAMGIFFAVFFLVKELFYPTLLPMFTRSLALQNDSADALFKRTFWLVTVVLAAISLLLLIGAPTAARLLVPGFSRDQHDKTVFLLRFLIPGIMGLGLVAITSTILNARGKFFISVTGEAMFKVLIVIGFVLLLPTGKMGVIPLTINISALACLIFHLCYMDERKSLLKSYSHDYQFFNQMLLLMAPLIFGVVFSRVSDLVDNLIASQLPTGQLAYLNYARKLIDAILLIGPVAVATVVYPKISHLISQQRWTECRQLLNDTIQLLLYVSVPIACLIILLRQPLIQCLFQHGRFDSLSTAGTSDALMVYGLGLMTFSLEPLIVFSFFALSDTKTPVLIGIFGVIVNILLAIILARHFQFMGIAAALIVTKSLKVLFLMYLLGKKHNRLGIRLELKFFLKLVITIFFLAFTAKAISPSSVSQSLIPLLVWNLFVPGMGGLLVYVGVSFLMRMEEMKKLTRWISIKWN